MSLIKHWAKLVNESAESPDMIQEADQQTLDRILNCAKTWMTASEETEDYESEVEEVSRAIVEISTSDSKFIFKNNRGNSFNPNNNLFNYLTSEDVWYYDCSDESQIHPYGIGGFISFCVDQEDGLKPLSDSISDLFGSFARIVTSKPEEQSRYINDVVRQLRGSSIVINDDMSISYDGSPGIKLIPESPKNKWNETQD